MLGCSLGRKFAFCCLALMLLMAPHARADIQTTLSFVSPSTITAGKNVTVDFGINFIPLPATTGTPEFIDNGTAANVTTCAIDPNPCTELQFNTTASTLSGPIFAEALTVTGPPFVPIFFGFTALGTYPITITYPYPGTWQITTAGATDSEQFVEDECMTPWTNELPGSTSCSSISTFPVTGAFDPDGMPSIYVTVKAATNVDEPPSLPILMTALGLLPLLKGRSCRTMSGTVYRAGSGNNSA